MNMLFDFLKENWKLILEIVVLLVSVIFFIVRKKPLKLVDSLKTLIIEQLPDVINRVERYKDPFDPSRKLTSEEKLYMALHIVESFLIDDGGLTEFELPLYRDWIIVQIEDILSTPQKKGE